LEKEENLVKKTCQELGINQFELSKLTKIDNSSLSRWKIGKRKIPEYIEEYLNLLIEFRKLDKV
jgi:transcriptional regulator with XRE-family HTH domain